MATTRYSTSVTLCEDTSVNYELSDLLKQADPNYSAIDPVRIKLYVLDSTTNKYVEVTTGFFTAADKDTFTVDMAQLPNFNGIQKVRVLGTDSTNNTFVLDLQINVTPVNDAPSGADDVVSLASGGSFVFGTADFGFTDPVEGNNFKSVVMTSVPASGSLTLDGVAVIAGQEIQASDIAAGKLVYTAPTNSGGAISLDFQVRDDGGTDGCGGNDLDLTPNTITFNVPLAAKAVIGDRVWEDTNANGVQDAGEAGIAGVTVQLKDANGNPVATTTTDGSGNYSFTVDPGTYTVSVATPAGYRVTESDMGPSDATDSDIDDFGNSAPVTVVAGETNTTVDAGLFRSAELGDRVWFDTNGNGQQDGGEAGVPGVLVRLYNAAGDLVDGPLTTDANGEYLFTNLRPGTYSVQFDKTTLPAGYSFTTANTGGDASDSDASVTDGKTAQTVLDSGESDRTWDAGIVANPGTITGSVLEDTNNDNVGDTPLPGVTVVLKDPNGNTVATTTTDANGNYSFPNVPAGNYTLVEQTPPGYLDVGDKDGGDPNVISVTVTPGETNSGNVFVDERQPGVISGTVREDLDNNGTGDTPIAGATIVLKDAQGNPVATTTTDGSGNYVFNNVPAGSYTVEETNKPGYTDVSDVDGGNPNQISVTLTPGQSSTGNDFVDERPATLGDRVWEDKNANGVQDLGEAGIAGVTVELKDENGAPVATTTTDGSGNYSFTVTPGTYSVAIVAPAGYVATTPNQGNDALDSDINASGQTGPIVMSSGENDPTVDAGLYRAAELGDRVWLDTNGNGQQDNGEAGVAGVKVTLLDASGNAVGSPLTTDANGNYLFTGLRPGTYSVQFDKTTLPAGYSFTTANTGSDASDSDANVTDGKTAQTVLDSGESDRTWDAGIVANPGTITGRVLEDTNNDNVGDTPLAGVTVVLKDANGTPVATTTTDTNGNYSFPNVPAGNYTIVEQTPPGYLDVGDTDGGDPNVISVTVLPGQTSSGNVFVDERSAAIGDKVWLDSNANGVQDAGEAGIAGVTVKLLDSIGGVLSTSTTDASGNYLFSNLTPGDYAVQVVLPTGYFASSKDQGGNDALDSDIDPTTGKTINTTLSAGETDRTWDAGLYQKASIGDRVWLDANKNGVQDSGEAGVAGVTVKLLNAAGAEVATATTDANGNYLFQGLVPGNYSVRVVAPTGYTFTAADQGGNDGLDSDVSQSTGTTIQTTLTSGENDLSWDAGLVAPSASYGDRVWLDKNANGVQDAGEAGLAGVTVKLLNSVGTVVATTTTDANGNYLFNNLTPGDYSAQVVAPTGYFVSAKDQGGNDATDSDFDPTTGKTVSTTLVAGENDLSWDAGLYQKASIGDRVWLDANKNGVQDSGEAGVAGVTVKLLNAAGAEVATATTDANGNYLFQGLVPGNYSVKVIAPTGYTFTAADQGGNDALDSDVNQTTGISAQTTLVSGENDTSLDAGLVAPSASYGDRVWLDKNANGVQDAGEAGLAGVTVKLLNNAGSVVATTTTDANGNYLFNNLTLGDYSAQVVAPSGYFVSAKDQGGNDATDSDFDPTTGKTVSTTLVAGENDLSWDAGLYQKASIGDKVWADCNNNGLQDAGEAGVPGVTVKLLDASGNVIATTLTDGNGNYLFKDLMPGTYSVQFVAPAGYTFTTKDVGSNDAIDSDVGGSTVIGTTNLVVNGSFENGATGWCGKGDYIEVNTAGAFGVSAVTGAKVLELDANCTGTVTGVYQDIATVAGQSYQLSLDVAQRAGYAASTNTVEVFWEGVKIATIDPTSTALTKYTFTVTAADASSRLEFREQAGDDDSVGGIIDNVALYTIGTGGQVGTTIQTTLESGENDLSWDAGLTVKPVTACFDFSGNTATDGTDGNLLCYTNNGISVNASAFSRDKASGAWAKAYLGAYGGGLGVTDGSEGSGSGSTHTVDNNGTRDNYVLFEFSQVVAVDKAYLGYVVGDSDAKVWIGTVDGAFNSHINLSDAVLSSMGFTEVNATTLTSARWADLNANGFVGNVLVIAANPGQTDDYFKIEQLVVNSASAFCATDVSIGDRVWNDANMNGVQDSGEAGISGVTVKLLNSAGSVVTTTTTDANGNYLFSKLAAGDYKIQVVTPNGYTITGKDQGGNDAADSDIDGTGTTGIYTLTQGSNNLSVDAGFYCPPVTGKIGDRVWEDANFNGIQDAGEAGIKGITVKLLNSAGAVVATTTTDASGNYLFNNVNAGDYKVQVVTPTGYYVTKQDQAGWNGTDSTFNGSGYTGTISLAAGQTLTKVDAGLYRKASVGDKVWMDFNGNGLQDSGDGGVINVTVKLLDASGVVVATTKTDGYGCYSFTNLNPGQYSLQFDKSSAYYYTGRYDWWGNALTQSVNQSSYQWTTKDAYSNAYDAADSDVARVSSTYYNQGNTDKFTLVSGEYDNTLDAGICPIVIDLDGNGIQTISRENANGTFDLLGTGVAVKSGWLSGGDGFLAIDSNGNGRIDDISELFGGNAVGQGFAKLSAFDSNGDGLVDRNDAAFGELKIWVDANGNHQTDAGELLGLTDAGVASLNLDYFALPAIDEQGNLHLERSVATLADGRAVDMTDVYFNVDAQEAAQAGAELPTMAELLGDDTSLDLLLGVSVAAADVAAVAAPVSDAAVAALGQLSSLYQEQQYALMAA